MSLFKTAVPVSIAVLTVLFASCASRPVIVRQVIPIMEADSTTKTNFSSPNQLLKESDGISISLHFLDRAELYDMLKKNKVRNQGSGGVDPVVTTFLIEIKNGRKSRIKIDQNSIVLLDGLGRQFPVFDLDSFKDQYPAVYEQTTQYFFLFDKYIPNPDRKQDAKSDRSLFQGGYVYPGSTVRGILTFDRISELAKTISVIIPDIQFFDDNDKPEKKSDMRFDFIQTIIRQGD